MPVSKNQTQDCLARYKQSCKKRQKMKRNICACTAHAPWAPHKSGYSQSVGLTEYDSSLRIVHSIREQDPSVAIVEMLREHRCDPSYCPTARINAPNGLCKIYNLALREQTECASQYDIAVSHHIDKAATVHGGPIVLARGGDEAHEICVALLDEYERLSGIKRRRRRGGGAGCDGVYLDGDVQSFFGYKFFLARGARISIIVETGVISCRRDTDYLTSDAGVNAWASATLHALRAGG